ncbi:putative bromodomain-containing protein 10 [Pholidichthys leucotaenia]
MSNDGVFANTDLLLPEVCVSTNSSSFEEDMNYEVQQAYKIFTGFLLDKHKGITSPFLHPIGHQEAQHGIGGIKGLGQSQLKQSMCLRRIEEKFIRQEYETITQFVADFRLMLENCYRYHGVDHWISKQAQKLEIMLEQKLTLLSRTLREKTTLSVTSKGHFGAEEERGSVGTSTRRRLAPRSLATITVGGHESVMVQALRLEEQQRAKEEKRQRELEKKEAEEMSAKEMDEWEQSLLSLASSHPVDTLWELPAIGHFLCLAQTALNLPEIIFFELERCLLMPRCSGLLSKIMSSLLSPPQRRATLHRRPALPYRRWESELRQRVMGWYRAVGASRNQPVRTEKLGLCCQFFSTLGAVSPLEEKPFHLLPFYQRVWLLKGLCDHVYETQKDVQDAVLAQPIHECRESILGYDSKENAYIHFPHFCGADLRIYCQSPSTAPVLNFPSVCVKKVEINPGTEGEESDEMKDDKSDRGSCGGPMNAGGCGGESSDLEKQRTKALGALKIEKLNGEEDGRFKFWSLDDSESGSTDGYSSEDSKLDTKPHINSLSLTNMNYVGGGSVKTDLKKEMFDEDHHSRTLTLKQEQSFTLGSVRTIKAETQHPCLNVGEHSYTGRSPARSVNPVSPIKPLGLKTAEVHPTQEHQRLSCLKCTNRTSYVKSEEHNCCCGTPGLATQLSSEGSQNSSNERVNDTIWTKQKKRKKMRGREQLVRVKEQKQLPHVDEMRLSPAVATKSAVRAHIGTAVKRKDKKKKHKTGKKLESSKKIKDELPVEPTFKLVCTNLEELRELISKTEDELDDLESTTKRLGRWYCRREAVKDLHSTLIRLLNELLPWEPKLIKAYQRNRLRLKKEFDDFKKHPEYNNFVREECNSSSSDDEDDEDKDSAKVMYSPSERYGRLDEEDLEHIVPRGLWSGASTREFVPGSTGEKTVTSVPPSQIKHPMVSTSDSLGSGLPTVISNNTFTSSRLQSRAEQFPIHQSRESVWATGVMTHSSISPSSAILYSTSGLPKGYTPIPTLLAKSVGNKVTLMKRPADCPLINNVEGENKGSLVSMPTSAVANTKLSKAHSSLSPHEQDLQQIEEQGPQETQGLGVPGVTAVTAALSNAPQAKPTHTVSKNHVPVVYKAPEGLGHLVNKDSGSVKFSVQPVLDQNTGEKTMQQVVILPSNLLIHKTEAPLSSLHQQQSKGVLAGVSKVASPLCLSTDVPGFSIPEYKIPVQQVAPLKDVQTVKTSPSSSPCLPHGAHRTWLGEVPLANAKVTTSQGITSNPSTVISPMSAVSTEPVKSTDLKQELKTVCIRDSQSILVTTRGGNTGIVKVQKSSDQNMPGAFPTTPVITISPQFKAFLVSKTSPTISHSSPSQTSPSAVPVIQSPSVTKPQVPSVLKPLSNIPKQIFTVVTGSSPVTCAENQTTGTCVSLSQGSNKPADSTVTAKTSHLLKTPASVSHFQSLAEKSTVVPSPSSSGVPQIFTQEFISKTGVKRASTDESSQVTKFILVTPSSSSVANVTFTKDTPPVPCSPVKFISQPAVTFSKTLMGSVHKHGTAINSSGQALTTSLSSQALKVGLSPFQPVGSVSSEELSKANNVTLPSGFPIQLSGKTTTIGQTVGALSHALSKGTSGSVSSTCCSTTNMTGSVPVTSLINTTSCVPQISSRGSLITSSQSQGIPSYMISQTCCTTTTSTVTSIRTGNIIKKDYDIPAKMLSTNYVAQVPTAKESSASHASKATVDPQPFYIQSATNEENPSFSSLSQLPHSKTQTHSSSAPTTCIPVTTSATGRIQQRIVINTSTPLAGGTQILLNNAHFVVPAQGLSPGSHVLIISSPVQQQVPTGNATSTETSVPRQGVSHASVAPRAPVLPQPPTRLPGVPTVNSPFAACTPVVGPSLLAATPNVTPLRLTGTPGLGSAFLPNKTNVVSALPRFPSAQAANIGLSPVCTPPLVSAVSKLSSGPASKVVTCAPALGSALATVRLPSGIPVCSSTITPAVATHLSKLSGSVLSSPSAITLPRPVISVSAPISSIAATVVANTQALYGSLPAQKVVTGTAMQPSQTTVRIAAPATVKPQTSEHTGIANTLIKKQVPAVEALRPGTRTQILPTMAVPPIVNSVSKGQTLPVATVTPIGNTVSTLETAAVGTADPSSTTAIITPSLPITSVRMNSINNPPALLTNQTPGNHSYTLQTSPLSVHANVTSKLLISPDGAILSTVQRQVSPMVLPTCTRSLDAQMISTNTSTGALQIHGSSLTPSQADSK